jgi:hypothetical protein
MVFRPMPEQTFEENSSMKSFLSLCVVCLIATLGGCESDDADSSMQISPGAVSECSETCDKSEASTCDKSDASLGAVSEKSCSSSASTCSKTDG